MKTQRTIPFTQGKFDQMQKRYDFLQTELVAVMARLKAAGEMGDRSENGAYKYAKFELGNIRRESNKLRRLLDQGFVVTSMGGTQTIGFGSQVTVRSGTSTRTFTLVSQFESDPQANLLSAESPLGRAVVGQRQGTTVQVTAPSGTKEYLIEQVA
ncbi:MAG: GreA/GreB family elongation factor [Candidatus Saccharibacteria bacterium]|nr:GreA/GreB family elongation factor [Candidatus Saccharibacteria bacterium]